MLVLHPKLTLRMLQHKALSLRTPKHHAATAVLDTHHEILLELTLVKNRLEAENLVGLLVVLVPEFVLLVGAEILVGLLVLVPEMVLLVGAEEEVVTIHQQA
jgi:hypothetical protein